jgi:hypothetical protein
MPLLNNSFWRCRYGSSSHYVGLAVPSEFRSRMTEQIEERKAELDA